MVDFLMTIGLVNLTPQHIIMLLLALFFAYLSIVKKYEPLLLLPLAFGILLANLPMVGLSAYDDGRNAAGELVRNPGLLYFLYQGIAKVVYPPMVFLCVGALTDFAPLIASPKIAIIGIGGQLGIFIAFWLSHWMSGFLAPIIPGLNPFTWKEAAAIGIVGSSDGPTSVFAASRIAPDLLPAIAIAAFSYMALVPFIQQPIMR